MNLALLIRRTSDRKIDCGTTIFAANLPGALLPCSHLLAQALLLLLELGSQLGAEVFRFKNLANLNFGLPCMRARAALNPLDSLFHGPHLPEPETGNQLLGLGEGPVNHGALLSREPDTLAFRAGLEPVGGEQHARFDQVFVEPPHVR